MKAPQTPRIDERRAPEFLAEMEERARAWFPLWGLTDGEHDFGRALLEIAARFNSEVAERLDGAGEKMRRGFLDWLAVRGQAARPARMPVVFKLADTAREGVLASAPVRMQADAGGAPVVFETEKDVRIVPGRLDVVVGIDADNDAFYLPPPGLNDLRPLEPLPTQWQVKSFAAAGVTHFQLDPEAGLLSDTIIEAGDQQYRIVKADKDLVTIDRPLVNALAEGSVVTKVTKFSPFDGLTYNQQQHALYLGDSELLNVKAAASIEVVGASALREDFVWEYFGKLADDKLADADEEKWRPLTVEKDKQIDGAASVVLTKPKGEIVEVEIGGKKSRWIRAFAKKVERDAKPINVEDFKLRINSLVCGDQLTVCPPANPVESPEAEAMANSTPLVLDNVFLPLGREPRQFDAFYLASAEAFSKKGAQVRICFELADPTFQSLAAVRLGSKFGNKVLAGVGRDRALHLFQFAPAEGAVSRLPDRDALRPPIPGDGGKPPASTKPIGLNPQCKPVIRSVNEDFFVEVAAGGTIWTWHENATTPNLSGWKAELGPLPIPPETARIDDIVPVNMAGVLKVVFASCQLWVHNATEWEPKNTRDFGPMPDVPVKLAALTPIWQDTGAGLDGLNAASDMIGVSDDNRLYKVSTSGRCTDLPLKFDPIDPTRKAKVHAGDLVQGSDCRVGAIRPAAYSNAGKLAVVTANDTLEQLVLYREDLNPATPPARLISLPAGDKIIGATVEMAFVNGAPQFSVLCKNAEGSTYIASWQPFDSGNIVKDILFRSVLSGSGSLGGAPVTLRTHVVAPGARGDLFVAQFDGTHRFELNTPNTPAKDGVVVSGTSNQFVQNDEFSAKNSTGRITRGISQNGLNVPPDQDVLYPVAPAFGPVLDDPELLGYRRHADQFKGTTQAAKEMDLDMADDKTVEGDFLIIDDTNSVEMYEVAQITGNLPRTATLSKVVTIGVEAKYWTPEKLATGRVAPIIGLSPASGTWGAAILDHARLYFLPAADPAVQRANAFEVAPITNHPKTIALQKPWRTVIGTPGPNAPYVIDATLHEWQHVVADTSSNPELSWEYSTGTAWESLVLQEEGTLNFKNTGAIRFRVPDNLAAVDWAGKTNHWIRARLIGGDYGHEEITVEIDTSDPKKSKQVVNRSTEGIRPPVVVKLHISYGFCDGVLPTFVLAEDSGTVRDQSDANRTPGAIVEAFVPLALTLGRLTKKAAAVEVTKPDCPPDCDCKTLHPKKAETPVAEGTTTAGASPRVAGREVYIGLAATPSEAPVNLLLLVEEKKHTEFAPMTIEALVADRFAPIVVDDATRALGESGVLSMTFAVPPTRSELFGKKDLTWLRLEPKASTIGKWIPTVRGAYLNAAWASATETLTRELLGSSDGTPNLTVRLARPPVLRNTLELRVKEPLGEEEREALLKVDAKSVLTTVEGLPGDWVLWKQVTDPDDELATARVYALDEASGEIRFGDGSHGKIPPIGRDSIVAFTYGRTEPDPTGGDSVPGNSIEARTALNLISPVETVESVTAADQAAGGAPPESDERVLRFGFARLRHRSRAVTAEDLEDLALQSSPDIVQARAFLRRGFIRLVIVMRGKNPVPTAAQIRELRRLLLDAAPASLSAPNVLRIQGPKIRRLRVDLQLLVETLDHAGQLSSSVKKELAEFFDTATGGLDKDGWALGAKPSEEDIALAISDAPYLESIENVKLLEITEDGKELPSLEGPGPREIVMLADDPIRIQFETAEVMA